MTEKRPADYEARQAIRSRLDVTMLVEAAAGTGKTTSLVARMVNLVGSGRARASTIAAITFTVKAASQLRERFQEEVEATLSGAPVPALSKAEGSPPVSPSLAHRPLANAQGRLWPVEKPSKEQKDPSSAFGTFSPAPRGRRLSDA